MILYILCSFRTPSTGLYIPWHDEGDLYHFMIQRAMRPGVSASDNVIQNENFDG